MQIATLPRLRALKLSPKKRAPENRDEEGIGVRQEDGAARPRERDGHVARDHRGRAEEAAESHVARLYGLDPRRSCGRGRRGRGATPTAKREAEMKSPE